MFEPIVLEFDLTRDQLKSFFASRRQQIRDCAVCVLLIALGVALLFTAHSDGGGSGLGVLCVGLGVFAIFVQTRVPQHRQRLADRLLGPTKIQLSDRGVEYSGPNVAERIEWSRMLRVIDRPHCWVLMTKNPVATYYIPKAAVPDEQLRAFTAQLASQAGRTYKLRKR